MYPGRARINTPDPSLLLERQSPTPFLGLAVALLLVAGLIARVHVHLSAHAAEHTLQAAQHVAQAGHSFLITQELLHASELALRLRSGHLAFDLGLFRGLSTCVGSRRPDGDVNADAVGDQGVIDRLFDLRLAILAGREELFGLFAVLDRAANRIGHHLLDVRPRDPAFAAHHELLSGFDREHLGERLLLVPVLEPGHVGADRDHHIGDLVVSEGQPDLDVAGRHTRDVDDRFDAHDRPDAEHTSLAGDPPGQVDLTDHGHIDDVPDAVERHADRVAVGGAVARARPEPSGADQEGRLLHADIREPVRALGVEEEKRVPVLGLFRVVAVGDRLGRALADAAESEHADADRGRHEGGDADTEPEPDRRAETSDPADPPEEDADVELVTAVLRRGRRVGIGRRRAIVRRVARHGAGAHVAVAGLVAVAVEPTGEGGTAVAGGTRSHDEPPACLVQSSSEIREHVAKLPRVSILESLSYLL